MIKSIKLENGKEYRLFTSRMVIEVKTSRVHAETGWPIWMRVNGARVISQVITAIVDADHAEALDMNAAIEWAKITPKQRAIHEARVIFGISLKNKHNTADVLEACHAEALEMNVPIPAVARAISKIDNPDYQMQAMFWSANDYAARRRVVASSRRRIVEEAHVEALEFDQMINSGLLDLCDDGRQDLFNLLNAHSKNLLVKACHAGALNMEAARELNARQARFVFHNTAEERAEAIEAAHAEALEMNATINESRRMADVVRAEFYLHNAVVQRDYFIPKAHAEALEMDSKI